MEILGNQNIRIYDKDQVERAEDIALNTHFFQQRRGGQSYLTHLKRTQIRAKSFGFKKRVQILAILHDALEDGQNPEKIKEIIKKNIKQADSIIKDLELLNHSKGQNYNEYVLNVYHKSVDAFAVKLLDMVDNMTDNPSIKQLEKYKNAIVYLLKNGVPIQMIPKQILKILHLEK